MPKRSVTLLRNTQPALAHGTRRRQVNTENVAQTGALWRVSARALRSGTERDHRNGGNFRVERALGSKVSSVAAHCDAAV
jgi:hypothetical protein